MVLLKAPPGFRQNRLVAGYARAVPRARGVGQFASGTDNDPMCLANNLGAALLQQRLISPQALERQFNGFASLAGAGITDALLDFAVAARAADAGVQRHRPAAVAPSVSSAWLPGCWKSAATTGAVLLQLPTLAAICRIPPICWISACR